MKKNHFLIPSIVSFLIFSSCTKQYNTEITRTQILTQTSPLNERLMNLYHQHPLSKHDSLDDNSIKIIINVTKDNIDSVESLFRNIQQQRLSPYQIDSIKKEFFKDFYRKHGNRNQAPSKNNEDLRGNLKQASTEETEMKWATKVDVSSNVGGSGVMRATKLFVFPIVTPQHVPVLNPWLISGLVPGSGTTQNELGTSEFAGEGTDGTKAYSTTWLYTVTIKFNIGEQEFNAGYTLRAMGLYNIGPNIQTFLGSIFIS